MFMPNSLQADKTSLMGERNNMLHPIISEYFSALEHKCQVEIMRHKTSLKLQSNPELIQKSMDWAVFVNAMSKGV